MEEKIKKVQETAENDMKKVARSECADHNVGVYIGAGTCMCVY